jgi:hypothetical protein
MIGAHSSSWITLSREKPRATFSISHVTRVKRSAFQFVAEQFATSSPGGTSRLAALLVAYKSPILRAHKLTITRQ